MVGLVLIGSFDATKIATGETEKTDEVDSTLKLFLYTIVKDREMVLDGVGEDLMMVREEGVLWWG